MNEKSIYLLAALDNIEGADGGVSNTAGKNATNHALAVVACVVNVGHICWRSKMLRLLSVFF